MKTPFGSLVPPNEIVQEIEAFFERHLIDEGLNYEIEAKFGLLRDKSTGMRIDLPITTTAVLKRGDWYHFDSDMSIEQHRRLNQLFNTQVSQAGAPNSPNGGNGAKWRYRHERTVDSFVNTGDRRRMRVTKDAATGRILAVIEKRRIADLELYLPSLGCDLRLSINTESKISNVVESQLAITAGSERFKDRLSYAFDDFVQIDLTQVKQSERGGSMQLKHELELEVLDIKRHLQSQDIESFATRLYACLYDVATHFE